MSRYQFTQHYESESWAETRRRLDSMLSRFEGKPEREQQGVSDELRVAALAQGARDPQILVLLAAADAEVSASPEERRALDEAEEIAARHPKVFEPFARRAR